MILNVNKIMCEEMSKQLTPEDPHRFNVKIGEAFSTLSPYLKIYSSYCSNQQKAFKTLETLRKTNQEFDQFLEDKMVDSNCRGLLFTSFLIKPVQRICKYPLFIKDLIKYTPEDHADYPLLKSADAKVNEVVLAVNEYKRSVESLQHVLELASKIDGIDDLVSPGRKYIVEFDANIAKPPKPEPQKTRHVFLFNDMLLICKQRQKKKGSYTVKGKVPFTEVTKLIYLDADTFGKYGFEFAYLESRYFVFFQSQKEYEKIGTTVRENFLTQKKSLFHSHSTTLFSKFNGILIFRFFVIFSIIYYLIKSVML